MITMITRVSIFCFLFTVIAPHLPAQVSPRICNDTLCAVVGRMPMEDSTVLANLHAGIPLAIVIRTRLLDADELIATRQLAYSVDYDVLNRRYTVADEASSRMFLSLDSLSGFFTANQIVPIVPVRILSSGRTYHLRARIRASKLGSKDVPIDKWVRENTENDLTSGIFPFSWLFSRLFRRGSTTILDTSWLHSETFTLRSLGEPR